MRGERGRGREQGAGARERGRERARERGSEGGKEGASERARERGRERERERGSKGGSKGAREQGRERGTERPPCRAGQPKDHHRLPMAAHALWSFCFSTRSKPAQRHMIWSRRMVSCRVNRASFALAPLPGGRKRGRARGPEVVRRGRTAARTGRTAWGGAAWGSGREEGEADLWDALMPLCLTV